MADEDREGRTEEPTARRLEKAREEGQVARSIELTSSVVLLAGVLVARHRGPALFDGLRDVVRDGMAAIATTDLTPAEAASVLGGAAAAAFAVAAPLVATVAVAAVVATVAQVGFGVYPKRILPDAQRLSPAQGLSRILSRHGLVELVKAVVKIALASWVAWKVALGSGEHIAELALGSPRDILSAGGADLTRMLLSVGGVLGALAVVDYLWQRREHRQGQRMTRHEVREELKQAESDPKVRQRLRRAYRDLSGNRMLAEVARADVVVTNPVHVAVALRYAPGEMSAPRVIAKGAEERAERIKQVARRHGVPIIERRALARALFRSVRVGHEIPAALYRAVAEILTYIYSLQGKRAG